MEVSSETSDNKFTGVARVEIILFLVMANAISWDTRLLSKITDSCPNEPRLLRCT